MCGSIWWRCWSRQHMWRQLVWVWSRQFLWRAIDGDAVAGKPCDAISWRCWCWAQWNICLDNGILRSGPGTWHRYHFEICASICSFLTHNLLTDRIFLNSYILNLLKYDLYSTLKLCSNKSYSAQDRITILQGTVYTFVNLWKVFPTGIEHMKQLQYTVQAAL
jgi:hypothetical protein